MKRIFVVALSLSLIVAMPISAKAAEEKNPYGISAVDPAPPNEIIFTVSKGKMEKSFTAAQLLKLKSSEVSIYEPFLKKRQSFTVIPLESFFRLVGISGRDKVNTVALNDYIYTNSAQGFSKAKALLAIRRDGKVIGYDQGGPVRLIFTDNSRWAKNLDAWNWSLISVNVK